VCRGGYFHVRRRLIRVVLGLGQFPLDQVADWLSKGAVVPFLGAGASRIGVPSDRRLPDGPGLAHELIKEMGGAYPGKPSGELAKVAQFYERLVFDRPALYMRMRERFQVQQADAPLPRAAALLAAIPRSDSPLFVITTNYDSIIERAFRQAQRPLCTITQNMRDPEFGASRLSFTTPEGGTETAESKDFRWEEAGFPPGAAYLFKMHGSVHRSKLDGPDDLIITEDDYVDFLLNSGGTLYPFFPPSSLLRAYKERRFLFMGYSLADWNFRAFLRLLARRNAISLGERRHWAIQRDPDELDVELWRQRNVNVYDADLVEFSNALEAVWAGKEGVR
jgi:hypothetical protein